MKTGINRTTAANPARQHALLSLARGTLALFCLFSVLLTISKVFGGNHVEVRLGFSLLSCIYLVITLILVRLGQNYLSAVMLVLFYAFIAVSGLWQWGINIAFAILLLGITITLAGILIGARYALIAGIVATTVIIILQTLTSLGIHVADSSWQTGAPSLYGEAFGYCLLFMTVSLVAWHFGKQTEYSLAEANRSAKALEEQKELLAYRLKEQGKALKELQLKEMQQLYKFAELGQLSTALMHDLANHVSVLSLDLEELQTPKTKHKIDSARTSISYIEGLVTEMRRQLREDENPTSISILRQTEAVIKHVNRRSRAARELRVHIKSANGKDAQVYGDPLRFNQVLTVLLMNAIDASREINDVDRKEITVTILKKRSKVIIEVSDHGPGIESSAINKIFKPFFGTKDDGLGLGLFVASEIVRTHFGGKMVLSSMRNPTTFCIELPSYNPRLTTNSPE